MPTKDAAPTGLPTMDLNTHKVIYPRFANFSTCIHAGLIAQPLNRPIVQLISQSVSQLVDQLEQVCCSRRLELNNLYRLQKWSAFHVDIISIKSFLLLMPSKPPFARYLFANTGPTWKARFSEIKISKEVADY